MTLIAFYRRGLGAAHGGMVGLGHRLTRLSDPVPVLSGLYRVVGGGRDPDTAADLTSVLCLVGFRAVRYAVLFWNQGLHQGAFSPTKRKRGGSVLFPVPLVHAGFVFLFVALVLYRMGTELRARIKALAAG